MTTRRRRGAGIGLALVGVAALFSIAPVAAAHVTVHPSSLPAGSSDVELTFRCPNERDDASTVSLQVFLPANLPLLTVEVRPVPGFTAHVDTASLPKPVQTDDGPVTDVVRDVTWTATAGGIAPGQYENFSIAAGSVPAHPGQLVFKALQTYSSGEVVRWIEAPTAQVPQPDTPAPVLTLTRPSSSSGHPAPTVGSGDDGTAEALAAAALALSVVAAAGVVVLLVRGRRRPG